MDDIINAFKGLIWLDYLIITFQVIIIILTTRSALYELKPEFRKQTLIAQQEAHKKHTQFIIVFIVSVVLQLLTWTGANYSSFKSGQKVDTLLAKNDTLTKRNLALQAQLGLASLKLSSKIDTTKDSLANQAEQNAAIVTNGIQKAIQRLDKSVIIANETFENLTGGKNEPHILLSAQRFEVENFPYGAFIIKYYLVNDSKVPLIDINLYVFEHISTYMAQFTEWKIDRGILKSNYLKQSYADAIKNHPFDTYKDLSILNKKSKELLHVSVLPANRPPDLTGTGPLLFDFDLELKWRGGNSHFYFQINPADKAIKISKMNIVQNGRYVSTDKRLTFQYLK